MVIQFRRAGQRLSNGFLIESVMDSNLKVFKEILEESMTTKTPIEVTDARKGDLIRFEWDESQYSELRAREMVFSGRPGDWYSGAKRKFLLDRPKKLVYAKGTVLWFKEGCEGPHTLPGGQRVTQDYFEGDRFVRVVTPYYPSGGGFCPSSLTTVMPDPHPVGATRWVTEDTKSAYGQAFKKGDQVTVDSLYGHSKTHDISIRGGAYDRQFYVNSEFLSATKVEPAPKTVTVPRDAVENLRSEHEGARDSAFDASAIARNERRSRAIRHFLNVVDGRV